MKACKRYEVYLRSTYSGIFGRSVREVDLSLTLLEDHARFSGVINFLLPYSEKNARELLELLKVLVEKAELYAEAENLR
ncbi:hypothetical protein [Thermococcus waiotapuensis]|uniref:Uncharacterized protein n=1 Tax=Thermococcus waiotapuensis TaxID=90909 RepID=A0AAE4NXK1_9EURY|nr:hypothetical protein [Thermococcus waiotapuensis]MDV3104550.1 hypothetical protein [Thermococcus waiotapuensis]